jgi:3-methyladenine DNA glycosylase AlkD
MDGGVMKGISLNWILRKKVFMRFMLPIRKTGVQIFQRLLKCLIIPTRKGKFLNAILEIANALLTDTDDLVQKGYGWMLKAASQAHQQEIFHYVISRKNEMPRTALRYAIEKMPAEMRKEAMKRG